MIDRQSCYDALFRLKDAGIDISEQIKVMQSNRGVPREIIEFLRDNSPQFQFYRYIQKYQKALAENLLDFESLDNLDKIIVSSSFITRVCIAVKYKNLDASLVEDLSIYKISNALNKALTRDDFSELNSVMKIHSDSLRVFYLNEKNTN